MKAAGIVATTGELAAVQISFSKAWLRQRAPLGGGGGDKVAECFGLPGTSFC